MWCFLWQLDIVVDLQSACLIFLALILLFWLLLIYYNFFYPQEHFIRTGCGSVSVIVYGDQEKPALITYPDLALNRKCNKVYFPGSILLLFEIAIWVLPFAVLNKILIPYFLNGHQSSQIYCFFLTQLDNSTTFIFLTLFFFLS